MEVIETTKGRPCALYNGFSYRKYRESKEGVITWVCLKEKSKKCTGRLKSKNQETVSVTEHQCGAPEVAAVEVKKQIHQTRKRAREENTRISKIYSDEMGLLHDKGYDFVTELPVEEHLKRNMRRQRSAALGNQADPKTREEIQLGEELLKMSDGGNFLLADDESSERILIFCSEKGKECLSSRSHFFMDGTFKSCSKQFAQIYTIHADLGGQDNETNVFPVVFALLPNKKVETYVRLFRLITEAVPQWNPMKINIDFEAATISALRKIFPSAEISGCYFHMKQCLWRKIQELGMTEDYKENAEVRTRLRMCAALAFLKEEDVGEGWLEIHSNAPSNEKLTKFFDYFITQ